MKILKYGTLLCLVAVSIAAPSPKRQGIDIEKTVAQVEQVLKQNSNLPRLTREDILQLLNDIRAEDEKSASSGFEKSTETKGIENERIEFNEITDEEHTDLSPQASTPNKISKTPRPPTKAESLMVVLPYTPRDGSTLQELFTRPPRVALLSQPSPMRAPKDSEPQGIEVPETVKPLHKNVKVPKQAPSAQLQENEQAEEPADHSVTPLPSRTKKQKVKDVNATVPVPVNYPDVSAELTEFLKQHGFKGNSGSPQDHFLLPLDGFKPLPPLREIDGSVQLPEKILLSYDLASPEFHDLYHAPYNSHSGPIDLPTQSYLYDPLRPDFNFELGLPSENKETVVPLDKPGRIRKAADDQKHLNFEPIEYDSVKVIPLGTGPDPLSSLPSGEPFEVDKRQTDNETTTDAPTESSSSSDSTAASSSESTTEESVKSEPSSDANDSSPADSGASIADLESSFGAPAPADPSESELPPPRKNGFYWMLDWNSFLEVGDGDEKVNIRFEPKLGDPQMFLPVTVP